MTFIGDPGSCHLGSLEKAKELVKIGADCGLDAVKLQLLTKAQIGNGNIGMDWDWLPELIDDGKRMGVEVFASVFDKSGIEWLSHCGCESIKFAYSQFNFYVDGGKNNFKFMNRYVSCDTMNEAKIENAIRLYCIPTYPVNFLLDFEGIFPRFDGFSSHCLGISQDLKAIESGAQYIEKHFQGDWYSSCPDGAFALRPNQLAELVKVGRTISAHPAPSTPHP